MRGELKNNALNSTLDGCGECGASNHNSKQKMRSWLSVLLGWWWCWGVGGWRQEVGGKNVISFYTF